MVVDEQQRGAASRRLPGGRPERSSISTARTRRWLVGGDGSRPSFWKIWWTWFSTVFGLMKRLRAIAWLVRPSAICASTLALAVGEHVEWAVLAAALHQP